MPQRNCPKCSQPITEGKHCPHCAEALRNGAVAPAEVSSWTIEPTPPDLLAWARQTFDEAEYLAGVREIEETGGVKFEDFIGEIEERVKRRR
jgi:hypothetical protein